jgi:hypothetical protein
MDTVPVFSYWTCYTPQLSFYDRCADLPQTTVWYARYDIYHVWSVLMKKIQHSGNSFEAVIRLRPDFHIKNCHTGKILVYSFHCNYGTYIMSVGICWECLHQDTVLWSSLWWYKEWWIMPALSTPMQRWRPGTAETGCRRHVYYMFYRGSVCCPCCSGMY